MAKNKESVISVALRLFAVCFVSALLLAFCNTATEDKIRENSEKSFKESSAAVMGEAEFTALDLSEYGENISGALAVNSDGSVKGICIKQSVKGYNSGLVVMTGVLADGKTVSGIDVMEHEETPGLGALAAEEAFGRQFENIKAPVSLSSGKGFEGTKIDAITGATKTSEGVKNAVNSAVETAKDYFKKEGILK